MSELNMTSEKVERKLGKHGVARNSRWAGHTKSKKIIFKGAWLKDSNENNQIIEWIVDYLGL